MKKQTTATSLSLSLSVFGGENAIWSWTERNETDVNRRAETKRYSQMEREMEGGREGPILQTTLGPGYDTEHSSSVRHGVRLMVRAHRTWLRNIEFEASNL